MLLLTRYLVGCEALLERGHRIRVRRGRLGLGERVLRLGGAQCVARSRRLGGGGANLLCGTRAVCTRRVRIGQRALELRPKRAQLSVERGNLGAQHTLDVGGALGVRVKGGGGGGSVALARLANG